MTEVLEPGSNQDSQLEINTQLDGWSILQGDFQPKKNPPKLSDFKSLESSLKYLPEEAKARARAANVVIYALELSAPELFVEAEESKEIQREVGKVSMVIDDYTSDQLTELREKVHFRELEAAPIVKALDFMVSKGMIKGATHKFGMGIIRYIYKNQQPKGRSS